jgi:hypothetical protein
MNQYTLKNIQPTAQIHPAESSRFVRMRKRTLQTFTALTEQPSPSFSPNPPSIGIDSVARFVIVLPVSAAPRALANVSANSQKPQILKQIVAVD